jgi:fructose-1-phosphate kinase PfkB-like protein
MVSGSTFLVLGVSREFYTGWLTHWGEKNAKTGADFTASALEKILSQNGSAVLYVCPLVQTLFLLLKYLCASNCITFFLFMIF